MFRFLSNRLLSSLFFYSPFQKSLSYYQNNEATWMRLDDSLQIVGCALITRTDHVTEETERRQDQRRSEVTSGTCGSFQAIV